MKRIASVVFVLVGGLLGVAQDQPDKTGNGDVEIGPDYQVDPDLKDKGNPKGQSFDFIMPGRTFSQPMRAVEITPQRTGFFTALFAIVCLPERIVGVGKPFVKKMARG